MFGHRWINFKNSLRFLGLLLPSWRFFDEVGHQPSLFYRYALKIEDLSHVTWTEIQVPLKLKPWALLFNPTANLQLHLQSHLTRLMLVVSDVSHSFVSPEIRDAIVSQDETYRKTQRWICFYHLQTLPTNCSQSSDMWFQFKLVVRAPFQDEAQDGAQQDYLISSPFVKSCHGD